MLHTGASIYKKYLSHGHKSSGGALGCADRIGFRIMARERMAKLIKYDHFEGRIGHIITYFMSSQILHHQHVSLDLGGLKK